MHMSVGTRGFVKCYVQSSFPIFNAKGRALLKSVRVELFSFFTDANNTVIDSMSESTVQCIK